jgi:hypothetical protein
VGKFAKGQSFIAAQEIMVPSGPNIAIVLGVSMAAALAVGIWLALLLRSDRSAVPRGSGNLNERSLKTVRDR